MISLAMTGAISAQGGGSQAGNEARTPVPKEIEQHLWFMVEGGAGWQSVNDIEVPYPDATRFSLVDFGSGPFFVYRFYLGYEIERHLIRAMVAPLTLRVTGTPGQDIIFQQATFSAGVPL